MSDARTAILDRLRAAPPAPLPTLPEWSVTVPLAERLGRFCEKLEASHAEVVTSTSGHWPALLAERLKARGNIQGSAGRNGSVLYAPGTPHGRQLADAWATSPSSVSSPTINRSRR